MLCSESRPAEVVALPTFPEKIYGVSDFPELLALERHGISPGRSRAGGVRTSCRLVWDRWDVGVGHF